MDNPLLAWPSYFQGKSVDELRNSLLYTTVELENTKMAVHEELRKRDDQLIHLKDLLHKAFTERDQAHHKWQTLLFDKLILQNAALSGISSIEDEPRRGIDSTNGFSSSDCEDSIVSSPVVDPIPRLPEKGKLLQAVMKAGPLLKTLLLAGPLPQWRHPPPPLQSGEIPPVTVSPPPQLLRQDGGRVGRKRVLCEAYDSPSEENKYPKLTSNLF